ncbi:hypothetical protein [Acidihalobacter ferrooxydans]|uniref:Phosphotyrosine protein phosphatase I domain-containing protein n=1 Tax=Acidihalobacter ferrooxydans TaxID=1765967 RepID=A0A1P8UIM2_9GAMM|nr:hypothetical protein [Acidihalobacter ferrooxydans]APZ43611.1 hypothetical protein BW247_11375 [Acidihalobacter ferrooxydans]
MRGNKSPLFKRLPHVLCVDESNSDRSQMAEGYLHTFASTLLDVQSAGMQHHGLSRIAVQVMQEDGVDIRRHSDELISRDLLLWADLIITISGPSEAVHLPIPSSAVEKRWLIAPPAVTGDADPVIAYRHTRDEIKRRVQQLVNALKLSRGNAA